VRIARPVDAKEFKDMRSVHREWTWGVGRGEDQRARAMRQRCRSPWRSSVRGSAATRAMAVAWILPARRC